MKGLIVAVIVWLAVNARAQTAASIPSDQAIAADPSGFTALVAQKVKDVNAGASIGLTDGKVGQVDYLPLKTFVSASGQEYVKLVMGAEFRNGEKARGIAGVTVNAPGIADHLIFDNAWSHTHVKGANLPPIDVSLMPSLPLDYDAIKALRWKDATSLCRITASVRFGEVVK